MFGLEDGGSETGALRCRPGHRHRGSQPQRGGRGNERIKRGEGVGRPLPGRGRRGFPRGDGRARDSGGRPTSSIGCQSPPLLAFHKPKPPRSARSSPLFRSTRALFQPLPSRYSLITSLPPTAGTSVGRHRQRTRSSPADAPIRGESRGRPSRGAALPFLPGSPPRIFGRRSASPDERRPLFAPVDRGRSAGLPDEELLTARQNLTAVDK